MLTTQEKSFSPRTSRYWRGAYDLQPHRAWTLLAVASERGLIRVWFRRRRFGRWVWRFNPEELFFTSAGATPLLKGGPVIDEFFSEIGAYLNGTLKRFNTPLDLRASGTSFQRRVWKELRRIPFGRTLSYGELAHRVDCPGGSRAVGNANGRNPLPLIIPCHRVVAADGGLGGYSGGLEVKRFLLAVEGVTGFRVTD